MVQQTFTNPKLAQKF